MRRCVRKLALGFAGAVVALLLSMMPLLPANAQPTHDPILFVHGFSETGFVWNTMIDRFRADGWSDDELHNWTYNTGQSNERTAREVSRRIEEVLAETGAEQVDLVTHSMGGLNTRWYVKFLDGGPQVDDWVSLGGPNHGTTTAFACSLLPSCREMQPGSDFLQRLNAGDETPGAVNYGTFWSPCDEIIIPQTSVLLDGATNTRTGCVGHIQLTQHADVYEGVRDFVE